MEPNEHGSDQTHDLLGACHDCIQEAIQFESEGNLEQAFDHYQNGLEFLMLAIRNEQNPRQKAALTSEFHEYIGRAEAIKAHLASSKEVDSPEDPYSSDSQSTEKHFNDARDYTRGQAQRKEGGSDRNPFMLPKKYMTKDRSSHESGPSPTRSGSSGEPKQTGSSSSSPAKKKKRKYTQYEATVITDMLDRAPPTEWDDIKGLRYAKQTLQEAVILPNLRPDLFTGLRSPPRGVLLFGPPGTGKTMLARAVASQSQFAFFNVSASSVTSRYLGDGEKIMKALFSIAKEVQPSVIFFDEIDALLSSRGEGEHEASRRLKTEFMIQLDGATSSSEDRVLVMGATNLPEAIDPAVLRRMSKRIYIPLPDEDAREALILHLMRDQPLDLPESDVRRLVRATDRYSGSDLKQVCKEAAMGPVREVSPDQLRDIRPEDMRPIQLRDFEDALRHIRPTVSVSSLAKYEQWNKEFGSNY